MTDEPEVTEIKEDVALVVDEEVIAEPEIVDESTDQHFTVLLSESELTTLIVALQQTEQPDKELENDLQMVLNGKL